MIFGLSRQRGLPILGWMRWFFGMFALMVGSVSGAYLLEIDTDGENDGTVTFNGNFSFGGDTTTASQSSASAAFGTSGADSLFGGDGSVLADTFVFTYSPDSMADNLAVGAGQNLGDGNFATGMLGGAPGVYAIYATWPFTQNVSGGLTNFEAVTAGDGFSFSIDQNGGGVGLGNEWYKLGEISYVGGGIEVFQSATANTFVSMRSYGLLFEAIPEPSGTVLALLGSSMLLCARRRR